jgi:hypothetical protein
MRAKKAPQAAFAEVESGLNQLAETTLLFLSDLKSIGWQIGESISGDVVRVRHPKNHFEVVKTINGARAASSHFLCFYKQVEELPKPKQRIAIAFALEFLSKVESFNPKKSLAKQMKIVPTNPGRVAVFFPAEKETSGFRFHLHAPFVPELSRASIKETPANSPLFQQLARLAAASLHTIRDLGLLSPEFLGVLPNPDDLVPDRYECIRSAIIAEMREQRLTPTYSNSTEPYAPAKRLLQAKASLKGLLLERDLEQLVDHDGAPPLWSVGTQHRNSNIGRFLTGLGIREWDIEQFVQLLDAKTKVSGGTTPDEKFMSWLRGKPAEWHQQFYALLSDHGWKLNSHKILRLSDGSHSAGPCYFPGDTVEHDKEMPRVDRLVYTSGQNEKEQQAALDFLKRVGVRPVSEAVRVEQILKKRYTHKAERPDKTTYLKDLIRFIALVEKQQDKARLFADFFIFNGKDDKRHKPSEMFLDMPFLDTGLSAYYEALGDAAPKVSLSDFYQDDPTLVERLQHFATQVGVQTALLVTIPRCYHNPCWQELQSGNRIKSSNDKYGRFDRDYNVAEFQELATRQNLAASRLIWLTMINIVKPEQLVASYRRNNHSGERSSASQLVHHLLAAAWVPQIDVGFVRPNEASRELLPNGFAFDPGWPWLKAIRFGEDVKQKSEEDRKKQDAAKELGFTDAESFNDGQWFAALAPEERQWFKQEHERKQSLDLPEHESKNPSRRVERVAHEAGNAPARMSEQRMRAVSEGREEVKSLAKQYLRQQYTNDSGQMFCQVCQAELPFKRDDGSYYFETVEFLGEDDLSQRHSQNYLALCPNHAAMFQHANGSRERLCELLNKMESQKLEVILAKRPHEIYFTTTHRDDLCAVLEATD